MIQLKEVWQQGLLIARIAKFPSMDAAAIACKVAPITLKKAIQGKEIELQPLYRICQGLKLSIEELYGIHQSAQGQGGNVVSLRRAKENQS